jgi:Rieske Fe-S protein
MDDDPGAAAPPERRGFLVTALMGGGLVAAYGTFAGFAGRYLLPARPASKAWLFVQDLRSLKSGDSMVYRTPAGATVAVARVAANGTAEDFLALSSTCPHLGCQVHWEGANRRFFCPCHNGAFDPSGKGISGPPADSGQSLLRYPLKVENGLLYIEVPVERLGTSRADFDAAVAALPPRCGGRGCGGCRA